MPKHAAETKDCKIVHLVGFINEQFNYMHGKNNLLTRKVVMKRPNALKV
jgi:hypothetical protein